MRLAKLDLLAYGHFRGVSLDFSAPGLHVVLGRNEAGKSTTLRAITGLLYGIDRSTPDAHVHKPTELRIGGTLEHEGERLRVVRRKGNANTLLDPQDKPIDEAVLRRLLGGVTQETFVHAYGLDHVTLAEGARALLEGKGDLGESLFDASVGGGGEVQRILAELAQEADAIYRPRGSSLPLNDALKAFTEASKQVRERRTLPEAYTQQEEGLATETEERDACVAKKKELEARRALIARARARAPRERQRQHLLDARQALGAVPMHLARIGELKERFGRYEGDVEQLRALRAEALRLSDRLTEALRRAGLKNAADLEAFRIDAGKEGKVNALLREREKLVERIQAATEEIARAERNLARLHPSDPAGLDPAARDALAAALERARKLGDIDDRVAMERAKLERQEQTLATKAAALRARVRSGKAAANLAAFVALPLPSVGALDALAARGTELARKIARHDERIDELEREAASVERQVASLAGDFAPPDAAALREARAARDAAWRELRLAGPKARTAVEIALEGLLRDADNVADRMIREADRVTTLARLRAEAEATRVEIEKARAERAKLAASEQNLDRELHDLFEAARLVPTDVSEMRHWLERHAQIADELARLTEARAAIDAEATKAARATAELTTALAPKTKKRPKTETQLSWLETSAKPGGADEGANERTAAAKLADLVTAASTRLGAMDEARRASAEIAKEELARDERLELRRQCNEQLSLVTKKLAEILGPVGLAADAPADEVNRAIEALRDVFAIADKRAETDARVREAHAATVDFEAALERCLTEAAPDLGGADAAARQLFERAERAREQAAQLASLEEQLAQLGEPVAPEVLDGIVDLDAAEEELRNQIDELELDIARYNENIGGIRAGLEAFRAEESAAEAASAAEQHLARVRDGAERWGRARLASIILAREIERYREENQGPLLTSASALFARLTLDAYMGIKAGFDEKDRPCLRCVRNDGGEVDVTGLSDGTRDQLYLSLRLASLLRRAGVAPPMPLILDDVLIQLDDQRASAALAVLAEVSRTMQVLFFTHHARLVDLAREAVAADELVVHTLSPTLNVGGLAAVLG